MPVVALADRFPPLNEKFPAVIDRFPPVSDKFPVADKAPLIDASPLTVWVPFQVLLEFVRPTVPSTAKLTTGPDPPPTKPELASVSIALIDPGVPCGPGGP